MSIERPYNIQENVSLKKMSTWRVGGQADFFVQPDNETELVECYSWAQLNRVPITILGGGSNVLISDQGVEGLVICTRNFNKIEKVEIFENQLHIVAQSGAKKADILKIFMEHSLAPALFLAGLPGDVGGGVVMNAGVGESIEPREFFEIVESFEVLKWDKEKVVKINFNGRDIEWSYRHSGGWQPGVITRVVMVWPMLKDPDIKNKVRKANQSRLLKQPLKQPSCGSTFRNPSVSMSAGYLIEKAGLKGFRVGGAQISEKHANFIITEDGATAQDVSDVILHVQKTISEQFQISLETEIVRLGR